MIGVIADDLTGAAELGAVAWRYGLRAEVHVGEAARAGTRMGADEPADLVCLDTNSRSETPDEAGRRAASAAAELQKRGARWLYKKTDSVLRGQVVAEVAAMLQQQGLRRALLLPANPSLGRVIRNGRYFVHGQPLDQTEFARDPQHPRKSAEIVQLLSHPTVPVRVCKRGAELPTEGIIVGEADSIEALKEWAGRRSPDLLLAGGAQFFAALLETAGHQARVPVSERPGGEKAARLGGRELFVCGSTSTSARDFIQNQRAHGTPVFSLPEQLAQGGELSGSGLQALALKAANAFAISPRAVLCVGLPTVAETSISRRLAVHLAAFAGAVLNSIEIDHVYAEGGATALELALQLGWTRSRVINEMSLGVATLTVGGRRQQSFTIKPGTYVWPAALQNAIACGTAQPIAIPETQ